MGSQVAIIVPAYHAHDTIKPLLHSIACQTKVDICKVIIVDDADEKSYDYLYDSFPSLDMIILHNETNIGPGLARNRGIEKAIGLEIPYMMFADADDQLYGCLAVEMLVSTIMDNQSDMVCGAFYEEIENSLSLHEDYDIWLFGKIYRTDLIREHNIRFPEVGINEDVCFNLHYWLASGNKNQIKEVIYFWRFHPDSITRRDEGIYSYTSYAPLCRNLALTYEKILEHDNIPEEKIVPSLANRLIRLYLGYNNYYTNDKANDFIDDMLLALRELEEKVYSRYWDKITNEDIDAAWLDIMSEGVGTYKPTLDLPSFLKLIKER